MTGFSKNVAEYPFQILDPARMITIPIRNITAPPGWPKPGNGHNDPTAHLQLDQGNLAESHGVNASWVSRLNFRRRARPSSGGRACVWG